MQTKNILNQAVADLSVAASIVHQVHWYMRGSGFFYLHLKGKRTTAQPWQKCNYEKTLSTIIFIYINSTFDGCILYHTTSY